MNIIPSHLLLNNILLWKDQIAVYRLFTGANPGFQDRGGGGAHLKNLRRAEGGVNIFGVFRVKNHDFTPTIHIFSNFRGGGGRRVRPLDPPLICKRAFVLKELLSGAFVLFPIIFKTKAVS